MPCVHVVAATTHHNPHFACATKEELPEGKAGNWSNVKIREATAPFFLAMQATIWRCAPAQLAHRSVLRSCHNNGRRRPLSSSSTSHRSHNYRTKSNEKYPLPAPLRHDNALMNSPRKTIGGLSLSQVAGHTSFVFAIAAFSVKDILDLRCLAISSTSLAMIFQYYRPTPLVIPLKWNVFVLGINAFMATSLYLERRDAENMSLDMKELYVSGDFKRRGFSNVEFNKLFSLATRRELKPGKVLMYEGKQNTTIYYLVGGKVDIMSGKRRLANIEDSFIGEMSFLDVLSGEDVASAKSTADVVVGAEGATVYEWDFDALQEYLDDQHEVKNAFSAYISHDLREKLRESNVKMIKRHFTIR